jgi:outer membrane protein assembly factor BamB
MLLTDPTDSLYYSDSVNVANLDPANNLVVDAFRPCTLQVHGDWTARCSVALTGDAHLDNNVLTGGFAVRSPWVEVKPMPGPPSDRTVKDGAWLAYDAGSGLIYAGKGNKSSDFYSYDITDNDWVSLRAIPLGLEAKLPRQGACGVADDSGYIYMAKGNNTLGFWRYDIATDSWLQLADVPVGGHRRVKAGSGAVYVQIGDSGFVYLLKGPTCEFYRFNVAAGTWETMQSAPAGSHSKWYDGSFLVFDGDHVIYAHKARYHELWAYDVLTATWSSTQRKGMPFVGRDARSRRSRGGGSGAWFWGGIYALKGGSTSEFWRYAATADTWAEFNELPSMGSSGNQKVSAGGCMVSFDGTLFALKGNQTNEFWRCAQESLNARQPSREGVMAAQAFDIRHSAFDVRLSPNPLASGFAVLRYSLPHCRTGAAEAKDGSATLEVFNASGRLVQSPIGIRNSSFRLDLRSMPAGVYLVKVTTEGFSTTQKLVVEH